MATKQEFTMVLNAKLQVAEMNQALKSFQSNLNGLKLPDSLFKSTTKDIEKLQSHLKDFEVLTSKTSFNNSDVNQILSLYGKIGNEVKALGIDLKSLGNIDLQKLMPPDVLQRFQKLGQLLGQIQGQIDFKSSIPDQLKDLGTQADETKSKIKDLENELQQLNNKKNTISSNLASNQTEQRQTRDEIDLLEKRQKAFVDSRAKNSETIKKNQLELNKLQAQAEKLQIQIETLKKQIPASRGAIQTAQREGALEKAKVDLKSTEDEIKRIQSEQRSLRAQKEPTSTKEYQDRQKQIESLIQKLNELKQKEKELGQGQKTNNKDIDSKTKEYEAQKQVLDEINQKIQQLNTSNADTSKIEEIRKSLADLLGVDISKIPQDLEKLKEITSNLSADQLEQVKTVLKSLGIDVSNLSSSYSELEGKTKEAKEEQEKFNQVNSDVSAFKSRIKYLLGLNNAVNLFKRGIRSAFNTVKDLDAAMTETAVVTNMTISDMWKQLPEYTTRANQLGVTTLDAYKAATLYYQQGLNDQQVAELSTETLKMARIAGLEAAEATDRMTNALRGFNMELNAVNAQKIDDVYSQLAAMSASNVDEISTAMTKVASLAHNANMEFETTAALLAQIIETTRESPETAGTALKTVVARFSEVKKMIDENQLKGTDEEGQVIDVNKVSQALRIAGIDLNKYFVGEVGLDDIFMELASKWDSLTNVQQRYIATQAAGSRQQSRFIAMMQDYARTQELVSAAYNSNGASVKQFEKTQDSLQSKLARLKNAWDEFLTGIANSTVIKAVVSSLTTILNLVNKLTGFLGPLPGTILKLNAALLTFAGLKKAFGTNGIISKGLTALGKTKPVKFIGKLFGFSSGVDEAAAGTLTIKAATEAGVVTVKASTEAGLALVKAALEAAGITVKAAEMAGVIETGAEAKGGLTNAGAQAAGNAATGAVKAAGKAGEKVVRGAATEFTGEVAGETVSKSMAGSLPMLGKVAIALVAVAAIAGTVYAIIEAIHAASPEGQLEKAKKQAEAIAKATERIGQSSNEMRDVQEKVQDYEKQLQDATNREDRQKIIQDQNEYILSLLEKDSTYAKYIESSFTESGQLYLTLDSEALAAAVDKIAEGAVRAGQISNVSAANVQIKSMDVIESNKPFAAWLDEKAGVNPFTQSSWMTENDRIRLQRNQVAYDAAEIQAQNLIKTSIGQEFGLQKISLDQESAELISSALSQNIDLHNLSQELSTASDRLILVAMRLGEKGLLPEGGVESIPADYYNIFGKELSTDGEELGGELLQYYYAKIIEDQIGSQIPDLTKLVKNENGRLMLEVLAGSYEGTAEEFAQALNELTEEQFSTIAKLLGLPEDAILATRTRLMAEYGKVIQQQADFRKRLVNKLYKSGVKDAGILNEVYDKLNITQAQQLDKFIDQWENYGPDLRGQLLTGAANTMLGTISAGVSQEDAEWFYNNITGNPILDYQFIQDQQNRTNARGYEIATGLDLSNEKQFNPANLEQWYFMSEEYKKLSEQIDKIIEENGQINSHNVLELAKNSATLQALLDSGATSAQGLANAINALSEGNIAISDLNENIINLYNSFDLTSKAIERAGWLVKNFDPGEDYGDSIDFFNEQIEEMDKLVQNREFGNPVLRNRWKLFLGEPPEPGDIEAWERGIELLQTVAGNGGFDFWTKIVGFEATDLGNGDFQLDMGLNTEEFQSLLGMPEYNINSYEDYIKYLAEQNGFTFTDDLYDIMIRNAAKQDYGAFTEIASIELQNMMEAYGQAEISKADVQAIADAFGLDPEDVYKAWVELSGSVESEDISYKDLPDKIRKTETNLEELATLSGKILPSSQFLIDSVPGFETSSILQQLGIDENGVWTYDRLIVNIEEIVPEVKDGYMTAEEYLDELFANANNGQPITVPVEVEVVKQNDDGTFGFETKTINITASNADELQRLTEDAERRLQNGEMISEIGTAVDEAVSALTQGASEAAATLAEAGLSKALTDIDTIYQKALLIRQLLGGAGLFGGIFGGPSGAKGGIVKSAAGGTMQPGLALTGEEAPEIVWNKEKGYAYLTGKNGPEIQNLQSGDRVFNGEQTRQILKRSGISSFAGGLNSSIANMKSTIWHIDNGSGSGGNSGNAKSSKDWKNELDWLYDLMEDIAEEEHKQTLIQSEYELAEKDLAKTGRDLYNLTKAELDTLQAQLSAQQFAFEKRLQQMNELQQKVVAEGFEEYLRWNPEDNSLEIDWDKINEITDKDTYDKLSDLVSDMEKVQDQMDEAQEATLDIKKQIQELQTRYLQAYLDFQNRVMEAVVAQYQQNIDSLSELNDTINEANESILDSIQKEIDLQRQIRDNTDTEKEIADMEARLAMLQRDTTGANQQEILELQKQLDEARKNYSDTLIDQAIDRLSQNNDDAQEQREKQIELLQAQLEYWQETGALWEEVAKLIADGFTSQGSIIQGSELWEFLKDADSWNGLSEAQKANWANELIREANQVGAYFYQFSDNGAITAQEIIDSITGTQGLAGEIHTDTRSVLAKLNELIATLGGTPIDSIPGDSGYASGGLATKTGLAMLHGTANEPEYVLNARQTGAFLRLADVLPSIFGSGTGTTNNYGTNVYVELNMNVGEIGSDYDVDRLVARVKDDIYDASSYRNVNAVSFLR